MPTQKHSNLHMFWSLLVFRGNSTQEPEPVVWNDKQADRFCTVGPNTTRCEPQLTLERLGRGLEKMQVNGPEGRN